MMVDPPARRVRAVPVTLTGTARSTHARGAVAFPGRVEQGRRARRPASVWSSNQRSASMAAMHPEPAAVMAWR